VTQLPAEGVALVMETEDGELVVGTGPLSLAELGVEIQVGDTIGVTGYWEDDELKAAEFTLLATGQIAALRDGWGRPVWSGSAQNDRSGQYQMVESDRAGSAGQGSGGQRIGWSGNGGRGGVEDQENPNVGQAEVNEWITLQGSVIDVDESIMVIILSSGELVTVEGRPWSFAQQQGFSAADGEEVALTGFYEGEKFEAVPFPKEKATLVESGAYRYVRHPIYSGILVGSLGWGLLTNSLLALLFTLALFLLFDVKSRREEQWLTEKYANYTAYQARVRKLIPLIY
jgi:hypothetical protein